MPTLCWIAPEIPSARYSSGFTILPVCPICWAYGIQPASTAARVAPTAPLSAAATEATNSKPAVPPTPRPPDTMTRASSMGAAAPASVTCSMIAIFGRDRSPVGATSSIEPAVRASSADTVFGRSVMIPPLAVKPEVVISLPPKTLISTDGPPSAHVTPVAFTRTPRVVSAERAPARSRPSGPAPTITTVAGSVPMAAAIRSAAMDAQTWPAASGSASARTRGRYAANSLAADVGSAATTIPATSVPAAAARLRPNVAVSADIRVSEPSPFISPITQMVAIR